MHKRCLAKETKYLEVEILSLNCIILKGIIMGKEIMSAQQIALI